MRPPTRGPAASAGPSMLHFSCMLAGFISQANWDALWYKPDREHCYSSVQYGEQEKRFCHEVIHLCF